MPLPEDVTTFTLTFGPYLDATGNSVLKDLKGSLTPISDSGRPIRISHPESGAMIVPIDIEFAIGDDGTASIENLPHTDNASLFPHPFRYKITWSDLTRTMTGAIVNPSDKPFAVPVSSGSVVDFDKQLEAFGQPGVQVTPLGVPAGGLTAEALVKNSDTDFDTKWQSLDGYVTDDELATAIENLDLPSYALDTEVTAAIEAIDFTPYATTAELNARNYVSDDVLVDALEALGDVTTIPNTLVERDEDGNFYINEGTHPAHPAQRNYVDVELAEALAETLAEIQPDLITGSERTKLAGIATAATANATDAQLRDRATHTGVQSTATITDLREYIEDTIGGMLRAVGTDLNISYDDANSEITIDYTGVTNDPEAIRDSIGAAMVGLGNISVLVDDNADTITIVTSATVNDTNAALRDRSTHTGTQLAATISDLASAIDAAVGGRITAAETDLAAATRDPTGSALVRRSAAGAADFTSAYITAAQSTSGTAATRKDYVDALGTTNATPSTVARRDANADISLRRLYLGSTGSGANEAMRKDYIDANGSSRTSDSGTWAGGNQYLTAWAIPSVKIRTLTGNTTILDLPATTAIGTRSGEIVVILKQDATGGRTVTWPGGITWLTPGGTAPVVPTAASASLIVTLFWSGTEWFGSTVEAEIAAATRNPTANTLVRRSPAGNADFGAIYLGTQDVAASAAARKDYVDSRIWQGTQVQYDAIGTKDPTVLYVVSL